MKSAERRANEKERVKALILDAARGLFVEQGIEGFSMRKLGERIGYTPTGIYFHFADKETLLQAILDEDCQALLAAISALEAEPDPVRRIALMGIGYVEFALAHPNHYRLLFMTPGSDRDLELTKIERGNPAEDGYAFIKTNVSEAIRLRRFRSDYVDADYTAQILWAGVHGVASLHIAKGRDRWVDWRPPLEVARGMIEALLRGVASQADALPALFDNA